MTFSPSLLRNKYIEINIMIVFNTDISFTSEVIFYLKKYVGQGFRGLGVVNFDIPFMAQSLGAEKCL